LFFQGLSLVTRALCASCANIVHIAASTVYHQSTCSNISTVCQIHTGGNYWPTSSTVYI
jgi:hypothetical protein